MIQIFTEVDLVYHQSFL